MIPTGMLHFTHSLFTYPPLKRPLCPAWLLSDKLALARARRAGPLIISKLIASLLIQ